MSLLLRTFVIWLLLLTLPYQGYAAASMLLCASSAGSGVVGVANGASSASSASSASMAAVGHDHAAMLAAQVQDQHDHRTPTGHDSVKCGSAGACCIGAMLTPLIALAVPALDAESSAIPFIPDYLAAVHLAHPERPPQAARA